VDVAADAGVHKGMPAKYYHGKTGVVWNVTKRAIGVQINKLHRNRIIPKRIHVRVEHVKHSKCRQDFLNRVKENDRKRAEAKKTGGGSTCLAARARGRRPWWRKRRHRRRRRRPTAAARQAMTETLY
jgi:large subunit ribosomal protein L21e